MIPRASLGMDLRYSQACQHTLEPGCSQRSHIPIDIYFRRADLPQSLRMRQVLQVDRLSLQQLTGIREFIISTPSEGGGIIALTVTRRFPPVYSMPGKSPFENGGGASGFALVNALHRL